MGKTANNLTAGIDFKRVLKKYAKNWYLFVIAIAIAWWVATVKNRYIVPIYRISTSVLIEDKSNKSVLEAKGSISADPLFLNSKLIDNQVSLLKSFSQIKNIIKQLDFEVSYFSKGKYIWEEIYKDSPFVVNYDTNHKQSIGYQMNVKFIGKNKYQLSSEVPGLIRETKNYRFGETVTGKNYSFSVNLKEDVDPDEFNGQEFGFIINNLNDLTSQYRNKTNIEQEKAASVLIISSSGPNKAKEKDYLNELTRMFLKTNLEKKNRILTSTIEFIDNQLRQMGTALDTAEQKLEEFRKDNKFMQLSAKAASLLQEITNLQKEKANLIGDRKYYEYLLNYLHTHNSFEDVVAPSTVGLSLPLFSDLVLKLSTVSLEKEDLIANSSRQNPYIQVLEEQISNMKVALIENMTSVIKTTDLKIADLEQRILGKEADFATIPGVERKYLEIERKYNLFNGLYDFLLHRKSEVEIQRAGNTPDHEIVDYAGSTGAQIVSASPKTAYVNAMIWAMLIPAIFLFLVVVLNNRIMSEEDIEGITDIPVIGTLIRNTDKKTGKILHYSNTFFTEALRIIKIKLNLDNLKGEQIILVTSPNIEDGKTYVAMNLASVYAMAGKRTLLLGFDLQRPRINEYFDLPNSEGVTNYLINEIDIRDVIQRTYTKNLDIILSGPIPPNPDELIESEKTRQLFTELRRRYDFIIMDTPSIGLVGDAYLLDRYSDTTLFVVRYNHTTKRHFAAALSEAVANKMKTIHIVYTDVKQKIKIQDINFSIAPPRKRYFILRPAVAARKWLIDLIRKL